MLIFLPFGCWQIKEIDDNLPFDVEDIVDKDVNNITVMKIVEEAAAVDTDSLTNSQIVSAVPSEKRAIMVEVGTFAVVCFYNPCIF